MPRLVYFLIISYTFVCLFIHFHSNLYILLIYYLWHIIVWFLNIIHFIGELRIQEHIQQNHLVNRLLLFSRKKLIVFYSFDHTYNSKSVGLVEHIVDAIFEWNGTTYKIKSLEKTYFSFLDGAMQNRVMKIWSNPNLVFLAGEMWPFPS